MENGVEDPQLRAWCHLHEACSNSEGSGAGHTGWCMNRRQDDLPRKVIPVDPRGHWGKKRKKRGNGRGEEEQEREAEGWGEKGALERYFWGESPRLAKGSKLWEVRDFWVLVGRYFGVERDLFSRVFGWFLRERFKDKGFLRLLERKSCYRWNISLGKVSRRA